MKRPKIVELQGEIQSKRLLIAKLNKRLDASRDILRYADHLERCTFNKDFTSCSCGYARVHMAFTNGEEPEIHK